jgi:protein phosphatase
MNRWYYAHGGRVLGPVTSEQLRQVAATGQLLPDDMVWPESGSPEDAVAARMKVDVRQQAGSVPDWVAETWAPPAAKPRAAVPDWVADVEQAEAVSSRPAPAGQAPPEINVELVALPGPPAPAPPGTSSGLRVGGFSSVGRVRDRNEDRFLAQHWTWNDGPATREGALLVVADGMGGYQGGDRASSVTVRVVCEQLLSLPLRTLPGTEAEPDSQALLDAVVAALVEANRVVMEEARAEERFKGMGATAAVVLIWEGRALVSHIGDCRVYVQRGDELKQLTRDQTVVGRMVELGLMSPDEAAEHPRKNEVLQAIGKYQRIEPSRHKEPLKRGDRIVVACDGLDAHVPVQTLRKVLSSSMMPPADLARHCVGLADEGGGSDNCTVVIAHYN